MPKFCIINCENSPKWSPITFSDMFQVALERPGDTWVNCNIASGDILPEDIYSMQGVIITGSRFNCRDREKLSWFDSLCHFIRRASEIGTPRIYGGCFGCQIIAFALGGEVDYNPSGKFILKPEKILCASCKSIGKSTQEHPQSNSLCDELCPCKCIFQNDIDSIIQRKLCSEQGLSLIASHGDCVRKLPPDAVLLASSQSCDCEMYVAGTAKNIIACQNHPEFELQYAIKDRIWVSVVEVNKRISEEDALEAKALFEQYSDFDAKLFLSWLSEYIRK